MSKAQILVSVMMLTIGASCGDQGKPDPSPSNVTIGVNDVSILFPIDGTAGAMLTLASPGNGGALMSQELFGKSAFATSSSTRGQYSAWRIVGARIDPCFPDLGLLATNPAACRRQLRLVAQSFAELGADDATIHLFYDIAESEFMAVATEWVSLATAETKSATTEIGVHPTLLAEGLAGPTAQSLKALIIRVAGEATLTQFTQMDGHFGDWEFGGFKRSGATWMPMMVFGSNKIGQTLIASNFSFQTPSQDVTDHTQALAALSGRNTTTVPGGEEIVLEAPRAEVEKSLRHSLDVDNPQSGLHAENVDCVSCHVAGRGRAQALRLGHSIDGMQQFANDRTLRFVAEGLGFRDVRMFGYLDARPVFGQRLVNESAAVADALQDLLAK